MHNGILRKWQERVKRQSEKRCEKRTQQGRPRQDKPEAEQPVAHFVAVQQPGYQTDYRDKAVAEQKS